MPHDDAAIASDTWVVRHVSADHHVVRDDNLGVRRLSTGAFSATSGEPGHGMSVDIGQVLRDLGLVEGAMVPAGHGGVRLSVGALRRLTLRVGSDPEPGNPAHGQTWGAERRLRRKLLEIACAGGWVIALPGVALEA
ncbi:MAG TPA: hypothetical protein VGS12_17650 [Caulobacteraceae bacterium]|nr:hypothetical protein [Caulobacteraceae bacterium]